VSGAPHRHATIGYGQRIARITAALRRLSPHRDEVRMRLVKNLMLGVSESRYDENENNKELERVKRSLERATRLVPKHYN
jgi:hypothetical protein